MYNRPWDRVIGFYSHLINLANQNNNSNADADDTAAFALATLFFPPHHRHQVRAHLPSFTLQIYTQILLFFFFCFFHLQEQRYKLRLQQQDVDVYEESVATNSGTRKGGRWERLTFKIILSYHGASFDGWQKQPDLNTVQGYI